MSFRVETMRPEHLAGVVGLQRACFPPPFPEGLLWTEAHLRSHLDRFAVGQFVAHAEGFLVGSASALVITEGAWQAHMDWESTTGGHMLAAHDPSGTTLYGADISVHPEWRGRGVGRALYAARFGLLRTLGLARYGTACRLPGLAAWAAANPRRPWEDYVEEVRAGRVVDRTLTPLLRYGLAATALIREHMDDQESLGCAAALEWVPEAAGQHAGAGQP